MIRIEFHDSANTMTMRISGPFVETFAENARALIITCTDPPNFDRLTPSAKSQK
jgi:hypothetical protein